MATYNYTNNGIDFILEDNDVLQFDKLSNASGSIKRGNIVPLINAVEIDWNGAKPGFGEDANGITTTGELLRQDFASVA